MKHNLFVNYYSDKHQERTKELDFCILENIRNKSIDNIIVIATQSDYEKLISMVSYHEILKQTSLPRLKIKSNSLTNKLVPVITNVRPTFNNYFKLMETYFPSDDNINIIANLDIIIPIETLSNESGKTASSYIPTNKDCLALCRWDALGIDYKKENKFLNQVDAQDCWIFRGGVPQINEADNCLGIAGTDNKIAYLLELNGYKVTNPSITLKTFHYHMTGVRNYTQVIGDDIYRIAPPYKTIQPTE